MTNSSVSLLPTIEFLEQIASVQFGTNSSYGIGFSKLKPEFFSTTNSEWLCLNSETEFLTSSLGTITIENPFEYSRNESSPVFININKALVKKKIIDNSKSVFLFRLNGTNQEVITISNYDKTDNTTTAPLIDCFSRECMTWFSSDVNWYTGFGVSSQSLTSLVVDKNGVILSSSSDILSGIIIESITSVDYTNIQVINTVSTLTPWVSIELSTGVSLVASEENQDKANILFLFSVDDNNDSLVAFAHGYTAPIKSASFTNYNTIETQIYFDNSEVIII